jgi:hypothetical protein
MPPLAGDCSSRRRRPPDPEPDLTRTGLLFYFYLGTRLLFYFVFRVFCVRKLDLFAILSAKEGLVCMKLDLTHI